ncbi:unnamed protein product [Dimorphilus gyrociliatus]|uniref:Uncharacterized protein n=1 Tax=Dimorphilus gyrociliatus TaxID=2664684 RepID=A0A7I8W838_9ANNE|nr:unnamed protein product [Dimorphilus gyrociliatus]
MDVESPSDLLNVQKFMKKSEDEENDSQCAIGGDNASLEVHLGDDSCHVSDVSSLSLQNIAIDDDEVNSEEGRLGRRDSMESTDSLPRDEPADIRIPPPSPPSPASLSPSSTIRKRINDSPPAPKFSPGLACRIMPKPAPEIENEYNYVKYARTNANNYVGMRLADVCSSREASPEKSVPMPIHRSSPCTLKLNDEALTEIPLTVQTIRTTSNGLTSSESNKNFTLSPEHTECGDSTTDAESFVSDGAGTHSSSPGMPNVEDGLSSGTGSDMEENSPTLDKSPKAVLRRKHCGSIDKIYKGENGSEINPIEPVWVMR